MAVGLVLVSHVEQLSAGVRTLAGQMAPEVTIATAGGTDDGGVGTSFDKVQAALDEAETGDGAIVLYDLGSAQMTAELALDMLDDERRARVRLVDAPLVEGALAAAVAAQHGDLDDVVAAAISAGAAGGQEEGGAGESPAEERATGTAVLPNPLGLHARPAAEIARLVGDLDAIVTLGRPGTSGVDAGSVLAVVGQGLKGGDEVEVSARGREARRAVEAVLALVRDGFGETTELEAGPATAGTAAEAVPEGETSPAAEAGEGEYAGVVASTGVAVGPVLHLRRGDPLLPDRSNDDPAGERRRLDEAIARVDADLQARAAAARAQDRSGGGDLAGIVEAHRAMLSDPELRRQARAAIEDGRNAERAWWQAVQAGREALAAGGGPAAERAGDVEDVGRAVLAALGVETRFAPPADADGAVVVAEELVPSDVTELADANVAGFALARGGRTAHAAIIARGLGVPMLTGLGASVLDLPNGSEVVLDAESGVLRTRPDAEAKAAARARADALATERRRALDAARAPVVVSGRTILVAANIGSLPEARAAVASGADGVGLLRTELLYVERPRLPDEDEQAEELARILGVLGDRPVTIRTLDVGGDKLLPALSLDAWRHGPLGERGLRYGLRNPELLRTQLRAILRAAHGRSAVSVMAPMVTYAEEAVEFRRQVEEAAASLQADGLQYGRPAGVGVMLEVPAAALQARELCEVVDFVSVGSNDLTQYVTAADRTNDAVAELYRPEHPALWRLLELLAEGARDAGCELAICGELAADPVAAVRLVELGFHELSMAPSSIPGVKEALRRRA